MLVQVSGHFLCKPSYNLADTLQINLLVPELNVQCDVQGDQNLNGSYIRKAVKWTFSVPDVRHFGHHTA